MVDPRDPAAERSSPSESRHLHDVDNTISITVSFSGQTHTWDFAATSDLLDLTVRCEDTWGPDYDWTNHKFIAPQPFGLLKAAEHADDPLSRLAGKKLRLMASKLADIQSLRAASDAVNAREARRAAQRRMARKPATTPRPADRQAQSAYTFLDVRPLPNLPNPQRSLNLLLQLKNDPGIRAAMNKHQFSVGLLTEMEPLQHTQVSAEGVSRTLGLNRNAGEVIELRLRTDAHDGYRDYRTIRKTLCHELAHNKFGPHDRNFWDLCHQIEREVDSADYNHHGRTLGDGPTYSPDDPQDDSVDGGMWQGGEYVLGGTSRGGANADPISRRDVIAKAAEERARRMAAVRAEDQASRAQANAPKKEDEIAKPD